MDTAQAVVGRYYDRNTRGFLLAGEGGRSLAIHRGIWDAGTASADQAAEYVPTLMLQQARELKAKNILDLGCGVGGTCIFLARGLQKDAGAKADSAGLGVKSPTITGITNSGAQVGLGNKLVNQAGFAATVHLIKADYTEPATFAGLPPQDLIVALESFIHSPKLPATLANATGALRKAGRLVICDDMIQNDPGPADRDLADFKRCWHAYGLSSSSRIADLCKGLGLELLSDEDLSPMLRLFRPRDRLAALILPVLRLFPNWPWAQNLVGGTALQRLLARACLTYRYQVWVKP